MAAPDHDRLPITHRYLDVGGLRMHIAEAGTGPLVLLLHGFPESWYSWRHQLAALAEAGLHAVAPDQRGYCRTGPPGGGERPDSVSDYTILHLTGDVIGLMDALGEERAVVAGHDWGAPVAWHTALLRPDRVRGVIGLSVPYTPRGSSPPLALLRAGLGDAFYMVYFQQPGVADAELSRDLPATFRRVLSSASGRPDGTVSGRPDGIATAGTATAGTASAGTASAGTAPEGAGPDSTAPERGPGPPVVPPGGGFLDLCPEPAVLPDWLTSQDIDAYVADYAESGFTGPLNWYRNLDRNWELTAAWHHAPVTVPALYLAGDHDLVLSFLGGRDRLARLRDCAPRLREPVLLAGCGHWTQQERPGEVSAAMIGFISELGEPR
jgi:pimeloyl-ACP methyl ester carboxylesterase